MVLIVSKGLTLLNQLPADANADAYIAAVETADGQTLESGVKFAIKNFVLRCKQEAIWDDIKSCCILAGARTLNGALRPLVGTAPTNANFVAGDYDRKTGLLGDGATKYLNSNYAYPTALIANCHIAVFATQNNTVGNIGGFTTAAGNGTVISTTAARLYNSGSFTFVPSNTSSTGFRGMSRSVSSSFAYRRASVNETASIASISVTHQAHAFFARRIDATFQNYSDPRLTFYSAGEAIDLQKLNNCVDELMNNIQAAIP